MSLLQSDIVTHDSQKNKSRRQCRQCSLLRNIQGSEIPILQKFAGSEQHVFLGINACSIYILGDYPSCVHLQKSKIFDPAIIMSQLEISRAIAVEMIKMGVHVRVIQMTYNVEEHIHSWILTHTEDESKLNEEKTKLKTPLQKDDAFLSFGADPIFGTTKPKTHWEKLLYQKRSPFSKPCETDTVIETTFLKLENDLINLKNQEKKQIFLFLYPDDMDKILISFE